MVRRYKPVESYFYARVKLPDENGCMRWHGSHTHDGYAQFRSRRAGHMYAHRYAYELMVGPIPEGLQLDHLCKVRDCCTPDHLEPVTHAENTRRSDAGKTVGARMRAKTHCPRNHPYDEENTHINKKGARNCKECRRTSSRERMRRKREELRNAT